MHLVPESPSVTRFPSARLQSQMNRVSITSLSPVDLAQSQTPARKEIHIDSGNATFHIRCLNTPDFEGWMSALRSAVFLPRADHTELSRLGSTSQQMNA